MKRVLTIVLVVLGVIVAALLTVPALIPSSTLAVIAADQVRAQTGRELTIEGDIERSVFPTLSISTGRVTLSNAEWAENPTMASVDEFELAVKFFPLLVGDVQIETLRLVRPEANLEVNEDGAPNWALGAPDGSSGADASASEGAGGGGDDGGLASLAIAEIFDGTFNFVDRTTGQTIAVTDINANASLPGADQPLRLEGSGAVERRAGDARRHHRSAGGRRRRRTGRGPDRAECAGPGVDA